MYFLIVSFDFKYIYNARLLITSHNLSRRGHILLSEKRDALICFCFLAEKGLSTAPLGLFGVANCLQLGELSKAVVHL